MHKEIYYPLKIDKNEISFALAELIFNAEMERFFTNSDEIEVYSKDGVWFIRDYGRGIKMSHFVEAGNWNKMRNENTKQNETIGLVDAIGCLISQNVEIQFFSRHNTLSFEYIFLDLKKNEGDLLIKYSEPIDYSFEGSLIELKGIQDEDMMDAERYFRHFWKKMRFENTKYGQLFTTYSKKGAVYVNGVKIDNLFDSHLSYNITTPNDSLIEAINRNRFTIPKELYKGIIEKVLLSCKSRSTALDILYQNYLYEQHEIFNNETWIEILIHFIKILNKDGSSVCISYADCKHKLRYSIYAKELNLKVIIVRDQLIRSLYGMKDYENNPILLKNDLLRKYKSFQPIEIKYNQLDNNEKKTYSHLKYIFQLFGGHPTELKKVCLFEIHRNDLNFECIRMVFWKKSEGVLYINKLALKSIKRFSATIIQGLIIVKFKYKPLTEQFESKMIEIMGDITTQYIYNKKVNLK